MPGRTSLKKGLTQTSKEEGGSTTRTTAQIEKYYSGGKRPFSYKKNDRGKIVKIPQMLTGGQAAIAAKAPPPNKIDAKDFAVLRAEKAKGRGMGLQDESVQPGKVMKAKKGKLVPLKEDSTKAISSVKPSAGGKGSGTTNLGNPRKSGENFMERRLKLKGLGKAGRIGAAAALLGLAGAGAAKLGQTIGRKMSEKKKNKKMGGGMMKKYSKGGGADSGRIGEMKSRLAVAADKVDGFRKARGKVSPRDYDKITERMKTYSLAASMKDKDRLTDRDIKKASSLVKGKMGGGMIAPSQRPGYSKGTMVKARGCKLGRTRPTKIT